MHTYARPHTHRGGTGTGTNTGTHPIHTHHGIRWVSLSGETSLVVVLSVLLSWFVPRQTNQARVSPSLSLSCPACLCCRSVLSVSLSDKKKDHRRTRREGGRRRTPTKHCSHTSWDRNFHAMETTDRTGTSKQLTTNKTIRILKTLVLFCHRHGTVSASVLKKMLWIEKDFGVKNPL